jgi:SAM-dependent methyltransferase
MHGQTLTITLPCSAMSQRRNMTANPPLLERVDEYYTGKLAAHGPTAKGVDWNSADSQRLRFEQFSRLWRNAAHFSLNDLGCGYGALYDYLAAEGRTVDYLGIDVSAAMIDEAYRRSAGKTSCKFMIGSTFSRTADYCVASGIFNVRLAAADAAWEAHMFATLAEMHRACRAGFAFNCLTRFSDPARMRPDLYYTDPAELFNYCKQKFAHNVALLHDYGLYEFTIIVHKDGE